MVLDIGRIAGDLPLSVRVPMMDVGGMLVFMFSALVPVRMSVFTRDRRLVYMVVVPVVVTMQVLVLDGKMNVPVGMPLREVQKDSCAERDRGEPRPPACLPVAQHPRQASADEGPGRKDRTGANRTNAALREQIEAETESIASRTAQQ